MKTHDAATGKTSVVDKDRYVEAVLVAVREALEAAAERYERTGATAPAVEELRGSLMDLVAAPDDENPLASWVGPFWSGKRVRDELRLASRQALDSRRRAHAVLGVKTSDGAVIYPVWQFHRRDETVEVRPAVGRVFAILGAHDEWAVAVLLNTPAPELEGLTPLDWVRQLRSEATLLQFARTVDTEWSR